MNRLLLHIAAFIIILTSSFQSARAGDETHPHPCLKCHDKTREKILSYRYKHSVVADRCPLCHINAPNEDKPIARLDFSFFQREWLIHLDQLSEDNHYLAEVSGTDRGGRMSDQVIIDIFPNTPSEHEGQHDSLKLTKLEQVMVNKIEKRAFVRAMISWSTDAPALSEIEYGLRGENVEIFKRNDRYTKRHEIVLDGLKHKSMYYVRAVSRDIYGSTLKSEEFTVDTSQGFSPVQEIIPDNLVRPHVAHVEVIRGHESKETYLKVDVNKPVKLSVVITKSLTSEEKHGSGLLSEKFSKIDVCYKCHPHNASHPVGVKAESPKIRTPEGLPTIEDGIITCITCHEPHGGNKRYFSRFDSSKDLCMRCHLERYGRRM